jgi:hypothetical protein
MRTCREATTIILSSTAVIWAAPATCPAIIRELLTFFNARPANGAPFAVGTDMSTIHLFILVIEPEDVAREAEEGRIM